jgi:hypothetical protein
MGLSSPFAANPPGRIAADSRAWPVPSGFPEEAQRADFSDTWSLHPITAPMSVKEFEALKKMITEQVPEGGRRDRAINQIERLNPTKTSKTEDQIQDFWDDQEDISLSHEDYEKSLAKIWSAICASRTARSLDARKIPF